MGDKDDLSNSSAGEITNPTLIEALKMARSSVEAFDRSISTVRQFYFIVLGIVVAAASTILKDNPLPGSLIIIQMLCIFLALFTFIMWGLEIHYHNYLRVVAKVGETIEERLFKKDAEDVGITTKLAIYRSKEKLTANIYHFIYILPWVGVIFILGYSARNELFAGNVLSLLFFTGAILFLILTGLAFLLVEIKIREFNSMEKAVAEKVFKLEERQLSELNFLEKVAFRIFILMYSTLFHIQKKITLPKLDSKNNKK